MTQIKRIIRGRAKVTQVQSAKLGCNCMVDSVRKNPQYKVITLLLFLVAAFSSPASISDSDSLSGFSLPKGSAENGRQAFIDLDCTACHSVWQLDLPPPEEIFEVSVILGGPSGTRISYGELVTSIINPSYKLARGYPKTAVEEGGESKMFIYNDVMTVTQLIDIVTFLAEHYESPPTDPTSNILP